MKKIDWTNHFIELIVVFIGITSAFLLNNWRENRAESQLALKYYNSLLKDLTDDSDDFDEIISFAQHQDSVILEFVLKASKDNYTADSISEVLLALVSLYQFSAETGTYETIKYSGNLEVFSDYELREGINSYYNRVDEVIMKQELHYNYMNNYCLPFIYHNVDLLKGRLIPGVSINTEFINVALGFKALLDQNLVSYEKLTESNSKLKMKLAKMLQH